ncbi:MAG: hypothetical protein IKD31_02950 [Clostridia bacterium]|nr:hypothetical protein [Clostridia bacterium]
MFCTKCGKEIADEALICTGCGCATANYQAPQRSVNSYSNDYIAIKEFEDKVKSIYSVGIICLILCLGIGLIFSFVAWAKAKSIVVPQISTQNPHDRAIFESAKRKLKTALGFANAPLYVLIFLCPILIAGGEFAAGVVLLLVLLLIMLLIGVPCTKHLNKDIYGTNK